MPSILIALTLDGTCMISPVSAATPASMASPVTPSAGTEAVTSPSRSSVTVVWPSRTVAS